MKTAPQLLVEANGLLRSTYSIADREGRDTNWPAFRARLDAALNEQHVFMHGPKEPETQIAQTKRWRQTLDGVLQEMKELTSNGALGAMEPSEAQARCSAQTRLTESIMWCGMILKALGTPNPYPASYDPQSPVVEPTADGLKL